MNLSHRQRLTYIGYIKVMSLIKCGRNGGEISYALCEDA